MKAAVFYEPHDVPVQVKDVPMPEVGPDNIVVKVRACAICGTDLHAYRQRNVNYRLWGHELSGDVVKVGKNMVGIREGDRVTGTGYGGYAEYTNISIAYGVTPIKLPDNVSYEEAATIEPMTVAMAAVKRGKPEETDTVLILGVGGIGLSCLQIIRALYPVKQVFVADISDNRLAMAAALGADVTINAKKEDVVQKMVALTTVPSRTPRANVELVFDFAGAASTFQQALEVVRPRTGRVVLVATYERPPQINPSDIVRKNCTIIGSQAYRGEDFAQCVELVASGKVDRKPLITHRFPLEHIREAMETQMNADESLMVIVMP